MKTKFYDQQKLEGNFIELPYGTYRAFQINVLPNGVKSFDMPAHALVTIYSQDNFTGVRYIISNVGNKNLKVAGFEAEFPYAVQSVKIECACNIDLNPYLDYSIKTSEFVINNVSIAYTLYQVNRVPPRVQLEPFGPLNPTVFIIPDFGTDMSLFECIQDKLAQKRFPSLILDLRGVGLSQAAASVKYADIIQDYRYIGQQLGQFVSKPIVIGHGVGGAIAQLWALTYKFELSNLILIDTAPYSIYNSYNTLTPTINQWIGGTLTTEQFASAVVNTTYSTPSSDCQPDKLKLDLYTSLTGVDAPTVQKLFTQNPDDITMSVAPKFILVNTLILHGLSDTIVPIAASNLLHSLIKKSVFRKIPTGHSPLFTYPDLTFTTIHKFLSPDSSVYIAGASYI